MRCLWWCCTVISLVSFTTVLADEKFCYKGKLEVLDSGFFSMLSMPNCTDERPRRACKCTEKLDTFFNDKELFTLKKKQQSISKDLSKKLVTKAKVKVVSLLHDLNYANSFLNISSIQKASLTKSCNLNRLKQKLDKCSEDSNIKAVGNNSIASFMTEVQNEGKYLLANTSISNNDGFFKRSSNKQVSCEIEDKNIITIRGYLELNYYMQNSKSSNDNKSNITEYFPIGRYISESPKFDDMEDVFEYVKNEKVKNEFYVNFSETCKKSFDEIEEVLCAPSSDNQIEKVGDAINELDIKSQKYNSEEFDSEKFLDDQLKLLSFCQQTDKKPNDLFSERKTTINKGLQGIFSPGLSEDKNFREKGYSDNFQTIRLNLCNANPTRSLSKLNDLGCKLNPFESNFDNTKVNCPLLVLDYILNTPTEELETQNIDKNLLAYKKTIEENKKSNGGDLILDFLGVSTPQEIASFKEAGIERSSSSNSNNDSNTKKNSVNTNATAQTKTPTTYEKINQAFSGQGASQAGQSPNGQSDYQSAQTYHAMTAQEQNKVSEVERELMRRLMGSKVSESTNAAKAEMYEKYSKEMMELAKEKARLESSGSSASDKDLASYEKKMQDLVNQMREDNKKIADAQKGNSSDNSKTAYINNFQGNSNDRNGSETSSFGGSGESAPSGGVVNANLNRALNETVNADKYAELTGKKPNQESSGATRSIASDETGLGLALIENNKLVAITSLEEIFSKKIKEKKPFVIAQKDNPSFKVRITPDKDNKVTITPLGNLSDPRYKKFYEEIEESFKTDKELQKYHRKDLVESFSAIQK